MIGSKNFFINFEIISTKKFKEYLGISCDKLMHKLNEQQKKMNKDFFSNGSVTMTDYTFFGKFI